MENAETIGELIKHLEDASVIWLYLLVVGFALMRELGWFIVMCFLIWG